jgi:hypothetical protein
MAIDGASLKGGLPTIASNPPRAISAKNSSDQVKGLTLLARAAGRKPPASIHSVLHPHPEHDQLLLR